MNTQMDRATTHYMCRPLVEENRELKKRIEELKKELSVANELIDNYDFINCLNGEELAIRDLEQQIRALHWVKVNASYNTNGNRMICLEDIEGRIKTLDEQAAKLKEQGNA